MRILVLNPNTSTDITARLAFAAKQAAAAGTILSTATAPRGVPYIATRAEAQIGGAIALEMLAERYKDFDAAIIAAFGDPGLFGARELFDIPVVGMAEASMLTACMLRHRFAIVTFARALGPWYQECVDQARPCGTMRRHSDARRSVPVDRRRARREGKPPRRACKPVGARVRSRRRDFSRRAACWSCRARSRPRLSSGRRSNGRGGSNGPRDAA